VVPPVVVYQSAVRDGDRVFTSGQLPMKDGQLMTPGKLGGAVSEEAGHVAARQCGLNALAARSVRSRPSSASSKSCLHGLGTRLHRTAEDRQRGLRVPWRSVRRGRVVHHVLGCHIEMTAMPGVDYPVLTTYQPDELPLQLPLRILRDVRAAVDEIGEEPQRSAFGSFILCPWTSERAQMQKTVWCHCG
jgi:hypothetical protein